MRDNRRIRPSDTIRVDAASYAFGISGRSVRGDSGSGVKTTETYFSLAFLRIIFYHIATRHTKGIDFGISKDEEPRV